VDDAGAAFAADAGEAVAAMGEQRVDQRAVFVAGGGVDDKAGWLVKHQEVGVLEEDGEGDVLRLGDGGGGGGVIERVGGAFAHGFGGLGDLVAIPPDAAFLDEGFEARAGEAGDRLGQEAVQPLAGLLRRGDAGEGGCVGGQISGHDPG
jgi:hypothetical protein